MPPLRLSKVEEQSGTIFVKSDCFPLNDTEFVWIARHAASGWSASGTGRSHEDCTDQINRLVEEQLRTQGVEAVGTTVRREQFHSEEPTTKPCGKCGKPSSHRVVLGDQETAYCCGCFIAAGCEPVLAHAGCVDAMKRLA